MLVNIGAFTSSSRATGEGGTSSGALTLLGSETQGLAIDFTDMSMVIRDTGTPANAFSGDPNTKLTYTAPSAKYIMNSAGILVSASTLRTEYNSSLVAQGLLVEPARTNLCLQSDDLTNASWTKSNLTTAKTATGPDGVANSATTCTASAGNATALQAITSGSAARVTGVWLKRRTGTGNIDLTQDNGSTWATQAITSSWARYAIASVTSTNPTVGLRVVTSGDAVDVAVFQHEVGANLSSSIPTTTATVTRAADNISLAVASFPLSAATSTLFAEYVHNNGADLGFPVLLGSAGNVDELSIRQLSSTTVRLQAAVSFAPTGGAFDIAGATVGAITKAAIAAAANDFAASLNGSAASTDVSGVMPNTNQKLCLGSYDGTSFVLNSHLRKILYVPRRMTNGELQALTT